MKPKKILIILAVILIAVWLVLFTYKGNTTVATDRYTAVYENLPPEFDGFRIAQISDLHDAQFGEGNLDVLEILENESPDMIALTGDMLDFRRLNIGASVSFISEAAKIAPCYYVNGNHEAQLHNTYPDFKKAIEEAGVAVLDNRAVPITRGSGSIMIAGINDPLLASKTELNNRGVTGVANMILDGLEKDIAGKFTVLLSHRPDMFEAYVSHDIELALCGHTHGGQIRLPLIGGLFGPGQGFFPKYDAGLFKKDGTEMIISRGIGNSAFPVRFNDTPEVVVVTLEKQ